MTKTIERKTLIEKRREILVEIDRLNSFRCSRCVDDGLHVAKTEAVLCKCKAATEIRRLGDRLLKLIPRRISLVDEYFKTLPDELTVDLYREIKSLDTGEDPVPDSRIRSHYRMGTNRWMRWKRENGLTIK